MSNRTVGVMEAYPDHILARIEQRDRALRNSVPAYINNVGFEAVVEDIALWKVGTLQVSFKGGDADLHQKIADAAATWSEYGAFNYDFGYDQKTGRFREWTPDDEDSHIRIGFEYAGYWSLVGTDSADPAIVGPGDITMNFGGFVQHLPGDWAGTVLHEFGHALGFHHEHQSPALTCDFNWELVYEELAKPPNEWPRWKVDHNLRQLPAGGLTYSDHDADSIMHYSFEPWMFAKGDDSPCYTEPNNVLSGSDKAMAARAYPAAEEEAVALVSNRVRSLESVLSARNLPDASRSRFERQLRFLQK